MISFFNNRSGQIALPFILLVGGIIIEIVIAGSIISIFVNNSTLGERLSLRALAAANSGIYDAMEKLSSNKEFASSGLEYEVNVGNDTATVSISRVVDDNNNIYIYTINSLAVASSRQRKLTAVVLINQTTGELNLSSVEEVPVS
ncbi:MAG: hypothetical protein WD471_00440 [Candidatus Paceibacterota bacterium]